jgi:predicted amino acid dehydrogenase
MDRFADAFRRAGAPAFDHPELLERMEAALGQPLAVTSEDLDALSRANVVVTASNSATPILFAAHLHRSAPVLVCDVAVPGDVGGDVSERGNVRVIRGAVASVPGDPNFELPGVALPRGQMFACTAETVVLGLAGVACDFSRGAITTDQVHEIVTLARMHGFCAALDELP